MRDNLMQIAEELTEFLHTKSSMMILQINEQQLITYCNNGFLRMFSLDKMPIGAGLVDFLLPSSQGVIFKTEIQEFVCNPRTGQHGILEVHKLQHNNGLSLWWEHPLSNMDKITQHAKISNNRFNRFHLII
jgi:PAS domain-containing protein